MKVLTVEQAAQQLQVSTKTVYEWLRSGKLPGRKIGKMWRMSEEALVELLRGGGPEHPMETALAQRQRNGGPAVNTVERV